MKFQINNGEDKRAVCDYIGRLTENKQYSIELLVMAKRSPAQNSLYHFWLSVLEKELKCPQDAIDRSLRRLFIGVDTLYLFGKQIELEASTRRLQKDEMTIFLNNVERYVLDTCGIVLPRPEDTFYNKMK